MLHAYFIQRMFAHPLRYLLLIGLLGFGGLLGEGTTAHAQDEDALQARNVVFIMGDDHAAGVYGAYGNDIIRTPNLDRLAAQGMRFDRAYVNSPVCSPSRQSIITGQLPHAAGVTLLRTPLDEDKVTIADHLKQYGYRTGAIGKMHFNNDLAHGFDVRIDRQDHQAYLEEHPPRGPPDDLAVRPPWRPFHDPARIWLNADVRPSARYEEESLGTYLAQQAVDFLRENQDDPFCLWVSFYEPHSPFNFPIEYAGRYQPDDMPLPPVGPEDKRWIPAEFRDLSEADMRGIVAAYYTSVEYMDANVGRVLDALEQLGLDENTLVVYVGDHGYLLGHHGRFEKHMMWEEAVRAPLVMRAPGLEPGVSDALVEFIDLVPTILDVLDAEPMPSTQGQSLAPLLNGTVDRHRDVVFSEFLPDNKAMVRTERWKYIFTTGQRDLGMGYATGLGPSGIDHRLYDMTADPHEMNNVAGDPQYSGVVTALQLKMLERFLATDPRADALPAQLSLVQSLVWFCEPPERAAWD